MFRVLAVDDDPEILEMYRCLLCRHGAEVDTVSVPSEVLKILYDTCHSHYDLVITDLQMPGLDGESLARVVRCNRRVPVVMITAKPLEPGVHTSSMLYLQKPLMGKTLDSLLGLVSTMMERKDVTGRCVCTGDTCTMRGIGMPVQAECSAT